MVSYSPHGRFIVIAGFGNLAGDVDVWDRMTFKKLTTIHASGSTVCEWCPDGRHILTATLYKRLKVDNGLRVWHYSGPLVHKVDCKEMHQVAWRFDESINWPLRKGQALSPPPKGLEGVGGAEVVAKPKGVYRPPGARGAGAVGASFTIQRENSGVVAGVVGSGAGSAATSRGGSVVGSSSSLNSSAGPVVGDDKVLSKAALKNQKKRAAKKKEGEGGDAVAAAPAPAVAQPQAAIPAFIATDSDQKRMELEKKVKALNKKLKQISEIKERKAKGEKLELTQLQKVEGEKKLLEEMDDLRKQMEKL
jgi:translation initiation factor 2A